MTDPANQIESYLAQEVSCCGQSTSGTWAYCWQHSTLSVLSFLPLLHSFSFSSALILPLSFFSPAASDIGPHGHCFIQPVVQEILSLIKANRERSFWVTLNSRNNPTGGTEDTSTMPKQQFLLRKLTLWGKEFWARKGVRGYFLKNWFDVKRKRLPKQYLLMKSQNDSTSGTSFIFLYFGKKFDS